MKQPQVTTIVVKEKERKKKKVSVEHLDKPHIILVEPEPLIEQTEEAWDQEKQDEQDTSSGDADQIYKFPVLVPKLTSIHWIFRCLLFRKNI